MGKLRFYNARILTLDSQNKSGMKILEGELWTEDNRICYIGLPKKEEKTDRFDREIDCKGNLLMPGLKNAHTHSAMTFLRSYAEDLPLEQWLHDAIFPLEDRLQSEDVYWFSRLAILEYLACGITACFDMYHFADSTVQAARDSGFRTVICGNINDYTGTVSENEALLRYQKEHFSENLVSFQLGCHAEYTSSMDNLKMLAELAAEWQLPVYAHMSETQKEVQGCQKRYGMSPVALFHSLGLFRYGGGIFHGIWVDSSDIQILREQGVYVITNPASNLKLASGVAPIQRYLNHGISIAIGTDGAASNNALNMFREMYLVSVLQKLTSQDAAAQPSAEQVLCMATVNSAHAMGLGDCDCLAVGKKADMIVINLQQPNMQPLHHIVKNLIYSGNPSNIMMTVVDGVIRYEKGNFFVGISPELIYREAQNRCERLLQNI